jgi:hypothetical protein
LARSGAGVGVYARTYEDEQTIKNHFFHGVSFFKFGSFILSNMRALLHGDWSSTIFCNRYGYNLVTDFVTRQNKKARVAFADPGFEWFMTQA